jgi:hypothetical protein
VIHAARRKIGSRENKIIKGEPAGMNNAVRRNLRRSEMKGKDGALGKHYRT